MLFVICVVFVALPQWSTADYNDIPIVVQNISVFENEFFTNFQLLEQTGVRSAALKQMIELLTSRPIPGGIIIDDIPYTTDPQQCLVCRVAAHSLIQFNQTDPDIDNLVAIGSSLCVLLKMADGQVCHGISSINAKSIFYILQHTGNNTLTAQAFCGIFLQASKCFPPVDEHSDPLPPIVLPPYPAKRRTDYTDSKSPRANFTILHFTDVHFDPYYLAGANAECNDGVCCRPSQGIPTDPRKGAGFWGDYRQCDISWQTIVALVTGAQMNFPHVDLIYFTGDIIDHHSWETALERNVESIKNFTLLLSIVFPDVPIYSVLGNHEAHPANTFAPVTVTHESVSQKWLYDAALNAWSHFIQPSDLLTLELGGFYTTVVRTGFRIVGLNNNVCYHSNYWLLYDRQELVDQLKWLTKTLATAEMNSEIVHILAHVPSNDPNCYRHWVAAYRKIIVRFSHIIGAIFNGHTHNDEHNLFYADDNLTMPVAVAWNGGSGTTYSYLNPNFRVYYADDKSLTVLDHETWIFNLTEANRYPDRYPKWMKEYSFKERYNLPDLSMESLESMLMQLATDKNLFKKSKVKSSSPLMEKGCDYGCFKENLCMIVANEFNDTAKCDQLLMMQSNTPQF